MTMMTSMESIEDRLVVHKTRVRDADGFVATIRYVGPVASAKNRSEIYAGVEWDDESRGIHDGSVICRLTNQLVRHFHLKNKSQCGGSFIRLNKIDLGVELETNLILSRYVEPDAPLVAPNNLLPYTARTSSGRDKPIEFWGEMKVRTRQQIHDLIDISLRCMGIRCIVTDQEKRSKLANMFGHIEELDLAGNLFCDWTDLLDTLRTFPKLHWLSFASNKIQDVPKTLEFHPGEFYRLKVLNVNRCSIESFKTLQAIDKMCPSLEELCVAHSNLSDMCNIDSNERFHGFVNLKNLDCSNCQIDSWKNQIAHLRGLPVLQTLVLDDNPLISTEFTDEKEDFTTLMNLQISGTNINDWSGIESLSKLKSIKSLRFRKCPLTNHIGSGEARAGTIARLPQIEVLNASDISHKERVESERRYISSVAKEISSKKSKINGTDGDSSVEDMFSTLGLSSKYPLFLTLLEKHKNSMLLTLSIESGSMATIESSALELTIKSMAAESCTLEPLKKRLPISLKVGRLKMMCARTFGLDVDSQILYFRGESDAFPIELDDDENTLAYYGVRDGAEILMNEIDKNAKVMEENKKREDMEKRINSEERHAIHAAKQIEIRAQTAAAQKASDRITN